MKILEIREKTVLAEMNGERTVIALHRDDAGRMFVKDENLEVRYIHIELSDSPLSMVGRVNGFRETVGHNIMVANSMVSRAIGGNQGVLDQDLEFRERMSQLLVAIEPITDAKKSQDGMLRRGDVVVINKLLDGHKGARVTVDKLFTHDDEAVDWKDAVPLSEVKHFLAKDMDGRLFGLLKAEVIAFIEK